MRRGEDEATEGSFMNRTNTEVVVVTGASGGVGRAIAHAFAKRGAHLGLLARGQRGLDGAREECESLGGRAIAIPTDVSDPEQVEAAALRVEEELGPIDVWVNDAMATVFGEFLDISAEEYRRSTEVTYLDTVYGTMSALRRMVARDRGTVVQVGSALAYRAIPLQAAYCGAKFGSGASPTPFGRTHAPAEPGLGHDGPAAGSQHAPVQLVPDQAAAASDAGASDLPA